MRKIPTDITDRLNSVADCIAGEYDTIRMDDIARESGIPRATLYYYFSGREEILSFLLESRLAEFEQHLQRLPQLGSTYERFLAHMEAQLALYAEHPGSARLLFNNLTKAGTLPDLTASADRAFHRPIGAILRDGIRTGEVRDVDVEVTAIAVSGAANTLALRALILDGSVDPVQIAHDVVGTFWHGIAQTP